MKKIFILLLALFLMSCSNNDDDSSSDNNPKPDLVYAIGDKGPGGGVVFYLDGKGGGLEAGTTLGVAKWEDSPNYTFTNIIGLGTEIGTGKTNTALIVSAIGSGKYAAKLCDDYIQGGFDDWFLPSKMELKAMYELLHDVGCGGCISPLNNIWSSSQGSTKGSAWNIDFMTDRDTTPYNNWMFELNKNADLYVNPVRKF